jgi:hypothetical protein
MHVQRESWIPILTMEGKTRNAMETNNTDIALYVAIIYV